MKRTALTILTLFAVLTTSVPSLAASSSPFIERALDGAVRIEILLHWPDQEADFSGSGWTRSCVPDGQAYDVIVSTAGHVLDVSELAAEARPNASDAPLVRVVVSYRDAVAHAGRQLTAGREDLWVDRVHDYGEIRLHSDVPRTVLPAAAGGVSVAPGAALVTVASPGGLKFGVFDGHLILPDATIVSNAPEGAWLSSIPVAPGASGAPVLDENGQVVATVVGFVEWSWGGTASVIVALPPSLYAASAPQSPEKMEVTHMDFFASLIPVLKLGGLVAIAASLVHSLLTILRASPGFSQEALSIVMTVSETAVQAVEQAHGDLSSVDKKTLAQQMVSEILGKLGVNAPATLVDSGIEAAVLTLNHLLGQKAA